jgi:hypothetical protein
VELYHTNIITKLKVYMPMDLRRGRSDVVVRLGGMVSSSLGSIHRRQKSRFMLTHQRILDDLYYNMLGLK